MLMARNMSAARSGFAAQLTPPTKQICTITGCATHHPTPKGYTMPHQLPKLLSPLLLTLLLAACGGGGGGTDNDGGNTNADEDNQTRNATSHNAGENCMECHTEGGPGTGVFTVAGTIYQSGGDVQTDAVINLYIHNTNQLSISLETDDSGNFYTTEPVEGIFTGDGLVTGVDVEVIGPGGAVNMPGLVTNGACSECHGDTNGNIVVN